MKKDIFELTTEIFKKAGVEHVLIGGFAVNFYGASRQTADVDFLIADEDREKVLTAFEKAGYKLKEEGPIFARLLPPASFMDLDLLFVNRQTLQRISKNAKSVKLAGTELHIPSLEHLIALKLHAIKNDRERELMDLSDIVRLIRSNKMNIKSDSFKKLCLQHGDKALYQKIMEAAGGK